MNNKTYSVFLHKNFTESSLSDTLSPFLNELNIGGVASPVLECNRIDLSHFKYADLSAKFGSTDKYISINLPHEYILMILSAEECQRAEFGFVHQAQASDEG